MRGFVRGKAADPAKGEAGAPEITLRSLPQDSLLEAAGHLSTALGADVPLSDYAEAALILFSELRAQGWTISLPAVDTRGANTRSNELRRACIPIDVLEEVDRHASFRK